MQILREPVKDSTAWSAQDFETDRSWLYTLDPNNLADIENSLRRIQRDGLQPPNFGADQFPMPSMKAVMPSLIDRFENGRGFFMIRGLPVKRYSLEEIKTIYWAFGVHMGNPVFQNKRGDLVSHVEDKGDDYNERNVRLYTTAAAANPHNDPSDIVGLLCVRPAEHGGLSMIASATSIYNRLLEKHPEYLDVLYKGFPHDLRSEGRFGAVDETTPDLPVFSLFKDKLSCCLNSKSNLTARATQGRPISAFEMSALKCVENLAVDPELIVTMDFRPGDMQFLNNYVIIHTRTAFSNGIGNDQSRLLLRLWLNLREGRPLHPGFGDRFNTGSRGGVPARQAVEL